MISEEIINKLETYLDDYEDLIKEKRISIKKVKELIEKYKNQEISKEELEKLKKYYERIEKIVKKEESKKKQRNLLSFI